MRADRVLSQLLALRLVLDGLIAIVEDARLEDGGRPSSGVCDHPPDRQVNATSMGGPPQVLCLVCGQQRPGVVVQ